MKQGGSGINLHREGASVPVIQHGPSSNRIPGGRKQRKLEREVMIAAKQIGDGLRSCCRGRRS